MPPRRRRRSRARRRRGGIPRPVLLGGMVAVPVILLLGIIFLVWPLVSGLLSGGSQSSLSNTEILIDRSVAMDEAFWGGKSKLEFAQQIIGDQVLSRLSSDDASWAIRQFGGPCDGENTSLATAFTPGNIEEAHTALAEVQIGGEPSFTQGMTAAIDDLADPELFGGNINSIIGIVGTSQICLRESAAETLNASMAESGNRIYVRIIGLGIPVEERQALIQIAKAMGGEAYFATNGLDVEEALDEIREDLLQVLTEFKEGDGTFLQTPVPIPTPLPSPTPGPTVEAAPAEEAPGATAGEPEPTAAPTRPPPEQPSPIPAPEPTASPAPEPTPEPTTVPTAVPAPTETPTPVPTPQAVSTPRPTARPPVIITNDQEPPPALPADCLSEFQPTPPNTSGQTLPHVSAGTVSVDGAIAPDGSVVTARVDGLLAAVTVLKDGNYTLAVEPPPGVSYIGKKVIYSGGVPGLSHRQLANRPSGSGGPNRHLSPVSRWPPACQMDVSTRRLTGLACGLQ